MQIKELLRSKTPPVTIAAGQTIREAMDRLIKHKIGSLVVVSNEGGPIGIITERDIFRLAFSHHRELLDLKVGDRMSADLVIGLPEDDLDYIGHIITQNRIRHIPILEGQRLCGIVSIGDILKARLDEAEVRVRYLTDYIKGMPTNR